MSTKELTQEVQEDCATVLSGSVGSKVHLLLPELGK